MTARENEILKTAVRILEEYLNPQKIIFFGSRAKGRHTVSSDFDFAVEGARKDTASRSKCREEIEESSGLYHIDVIFLEDVEEDFKKIIFNSGKVIYERGA